MLMASFRGLLPQQINMLLVPFKAKQLLNHLLSELHEEQVSMAEAFLKELLFKNIDMSLLSKRLDLPLDDGGAGWNKSRADSFTERVSFILDIAQKLKDNSANGSLLLIKYLTDRFHIHLSSEQELRFQAVLKLRLNNQIGQIELQKRLDKSLTLGGVGLHKTTAEKIVREVEIIMLIKYS